MGGGVGGLGLQMGGSSMKFWSNGGGSRLLNIWKSGEGHAFRYRKHKLCKISNTFSAVLGAQISKSPGGACSWTPLASECFHVHVNPISLRPSLHGSPHAHFPMPISDKSFPIWTGFSENELARQSHSSLQSRRFGGWRGINSSFTYPYPSHTLVYLSQRRDPFSGGAAQ